MRHARTIFGFQLYCGYCRKMTEWVRGKNGAVCGECGG